MDWVVEAGRKVWLWFAPRKGAAEPSSVRGRCRRDRGVVNAADRGGSSPCPAPDAARPPSSRRIPMIADRIPPRLRVPGALVAALLLLTPAITAPAAAQAAPAAAAGGTDAPVPNRFAAGDSVEVEYFVNGEWLPARVAAVVNDGYAYEVDVAPYGNGRTIRTQIHFKRVRARRHAAVTPAIVPAHTAAPAPVALAADGKTHWTCSVRR